MTRDSSATRSTHGSYVQLNTFDDKEKAFVQTKSSLPPVWPYKRCLCTKRDTVLVAMVVCAVLVVIAVSLSLGLPRLEEKRTKYLDTSFPESSSPLRIFDKAAVVADGEHCADIGLNISRSGGSAVDAAIAALLCNGVVNPQSMGLGGGFLMTIYIRANKSAYALDAREMAPAKATMHMFDGNKTLSQEGGLSIAIPGELRGYRLAHDRFGRLPWRDLVLPSVGLCREGFRVTGHLADKLNKLRDRILADENMRREFFNNDTQDLYREGETFRRPVLAETLAKIAEEGSEALYTGSLSANFLKDVRQCGGIISPDDLSRYQPLLRPAVRADGFRGGLSLLTVPPPGSGPILALLLHLLSGSGMKAADFSAPDSAALNYHRSVEAFKFAFAHRTQLGDMDFVNVSQVVENLVSAEYADSIRQQISDDTTYPPSYYKPVTDPSPDHGTAHVSVLAENGDAVSVTSTVNTFFGSLCVSPSTGVILNNGMDDFSSPNVTNYFGVPPSPANRIEPGKRPLSSMCPAVLVGPDGAVRFVAGGAGGTRIITATAMGIVRTLWLNETVKQATDAPRIHHQLFPNHIEYEPEFPQIYLDKLRAYGHSVRPETQASVFLGICAGADGRLTTNVDHRKGGSAAGY